MIAAVCCDKLKINKSLSPDGIHPLVIKELRNEVADHLTKIYNLPFKTATVPEDLRIAHVPSIFKRGRKGDLGNHRLVSLASVPENMLERLIQDKNLKTHRTSLAEGKSAWLL